MQKGLDGLPWSGPALAELLLGDVGTGEDTADQPAEQLRPLPQRHRPPGAAQRGPHRPVAEAERDPGLLGGADRVFTGLPGLEKPGAEIHLIIAQPRRVLGPPQILAPDRVGDAVRIRTGESGPEAV